MLQIFKPVMAAEPPLEDWNKDPYVYNTPGGNENVAQFKALEPIFRNVLALAMIAGALVCFIMFLVGGFKLLTSSGDPKKVQAASGTLTYAAIGLVLFIGAWFVMRFIREFTGVDVTVFEIPNK